MQPGYETCAVSNSLGEKMLQKKQMQPIRIKNKSCDNEKGIRYTKNFKIE